MAGAYRGFVRSHLLVAAAAATPADSGLLKTVHVHAATLAR